MPLLTMAGWDDDGSWEIIWETAVCMPAAYSVKQREYTGKII